MTPSPSALQVLTPNLPILNEHEQCAGVKTGTNRQENGMKRSRLFDDNQISPTRFWLAWVHVNEERPQLCPRSRVSPRRGYGFRYPGINVSERRGYGFSRDAVARFGFPVSSGFRFDRFKISAKRGELVFVALRPVRDWVRRPPLIRVSEAFRQGVCADAGRQRGPTSGRSPLFRRQFAHLGR